MTSSLRGWQYGMIQQLVHQAILTTASKGAASKGSLMHQTRSSNMHAEKEAIVVCHFDIHDIGLADQLHLLHQKRFSRLLTCYLVDKDVTSSKVTALRLQR
jgi:hypothetical protein